MVCRRWSVACADGKQRVNVLQKIYGEVYGNILRRKLWIKLHNLRRNLPLQDIRLEDFKHLV